MRRREFLETAVAMAGASPSPGAEPVADDERRRLENIQTCNRSIRNCLRKHLITNYLPFQAVYNLGEYPARKPWTIDDSDERRLDELAAGGVQLLQVHEEWSDSLRMFGADRFSPVNGRAFYRFLKMVHARRMKLLVYISSGYFSRRDPDFRPEWARSPDLVEIYWRYAPCSPASPGWRRYLLPRINRVMDALGVDGIYNDCGYVALYMNRAKPSSDEVPAFEETPVHDGALEDLLGIIYGEAQRRGSIVKVHVRGNSQPQVAGRVYDYLWVGEGARNADRMREAVKNYPPHVAPCLDMSRATLSSEDEMYLHSIPYLQFPVLLAGKPFTGERASVPGIQYPPEEKDFWTRHVRNMGRYYREHPQGPYSFGWWDSCPGRPEARPTYFKWLKLYRPMVVPGTWAYLEIRDSDLFPRDLPENMVASVFANSKMYLALANYSDREQQVEVAGAFRNAQSAADEPRTAWPVPARSLLILENSPAGVLRSADRG